MPDAPCKPTSGPFRSVQYQTHQPSGIRPGSIRNAEALYQEAKRLLEEQDPERWDGQS